MRATLGLTLVLLSGAATGSWVQLEANVPPHNAATSSWAKNERAAATDSVTFTVGLRVDEERLAALERTFWEVSDPDHAKYGQHLGMEEVTRLLAVPNSRVEAVRAHFLGAGATEAVVSPNMDMITVTMPVSVAEESLKTTLHVFEHSQKRSLRIVRASSSYSLPAEVAQHVIMVGELLQFPLVRSNELLSELQGSGEWTNDCDESTCKGLVTPGVLAQRYKLPSTNRAVKGNSMAVAEFQGQYYKPSDLTAFTSKCHRDVKVDTQVGENEDSAGVEAELDIEYIKSVAPSVPLTVLYSAQYSLLSWANQINSMTDAPLVHSVSYGNDEKQQSSTEYMLTCNTAFMKAGVRGMSILVASGDQGVCGREGCGYSFWKKFKPDFPGGSPYLTVVGGTNFEGSTIGAESAWSAGGGGFSDTFAMPAYQQAAVEAYKSRSDAKLPAQKYWNATGRGYPDVAALGGTKTPYCIATGGKWGGVAGTSAACPVVAGIFSRLNGLRLAAGKAPLGFLNPFIYKNPSGFQDVTSGRNDDGTQYGFSAVEGWDAATGFGTPDYEALAKLVMKAGALNSVVV